MKLGSLDLRAPVGLLAKGYGLYQTMTGQKGVGAHGLAIGTGVMASWLASVGRHTGKTLAEKRAAPAQPQAPARVLNTPPPGGAPGAARRPVPAP